MSAAEELKFERNSLIPIDPRTKIFLTVTVSTITMAGGTGGMMDIIRPCLVALPVLLLLLSQRWKAAARFSITYAVLYGLELTVIPILTGMWNFILNAASGIYTHMLPGFVMGYLNDGRIEKDYTTQEALNLSPGQQINMGLRPFELAAFPSTPHPFDEKGQIQCENFHFAYTKHRDALNIGCLSLPEGGIVALIGHNGAGKSTLARCLCGLEKHCDGVVKMNGKQYNKKQRLALCYMVMQDVNHQLFTESTEEEMLISMAAPSSDRADAVLERLDLMQFKDRHPMALSGGQKQRVAIATALVSDRKILVFDEPTSGLDLHHMKEVADELITIQEMGKTSLVITHDYELIVSCCTHVLHLEHGVVQEQYALDAAGLQRIQNFFIESR